MKGEKAGRRSSFQKDLVKSLQGFGVIIKFGVLLSDRKQNGEATLSPQTQEKLTLHRDFAKFFFSCSETVPWIFLLLAAFPQILFSF